MTKLLKKLKVKDLKAIIKKHKLGTLKGKRKAGLISMIMNHKDFKTIMEGVVAPIKGKKRRVPQHVLDALAKGRAKRAQNVRDRKLPKVLKKSGDTTTPLMTSFKVVEPKVEPKVEAPKVEPKVEAPKEHVPENHKIVGRVVKDIKRKERVLEKLGLLDQDDINKMIKKVAMELLKV